MGSSIKALDQGTTLATQNTGAIERDKTGGLNMCGIASIPRLK